MMLYLILSILAGVTIVVARIINCNLANRIGIFQGTFINYVVGLFFSFWILLFSSESLYISNINLQSIPSWAYFGGPMGVLIIVLSSYITPKISAFYLTLFIFIGQFIIGLIIDYLTLNQFSAGKFIGGFLVFFGMAYNLHIDKRKIVQTADCQ